MIHSLRDYDARSLNGTERIQNAADLPPAEATGAHELVDNTAYWFDDVVTSDAPIQLGDNTPLLGNHAGVSGFVYTGGTGAALRGTDATVFMRDLLVSAPGASVYDVSGTTADEFLVESCTFADVGAGALASLGTIDGFRVPTFVVSNFEDYAEGVTFTGDPDKIFIGQSPFRDPAATGTTAITLAAGLNVALVDIAGSYGKGFDATDEFVRTEAGGEPSEVLQLRGTTFDESVTKANILTGALDESSIGVSVRACWPLADSQPGVAYTNTDTTTVTITNQDPGDGTEAVKIDTPTEVFPPVTDRFTHTSPNRATYNGRRNFTEKVSATVSVSGSNTTVALYAAKNGNVLGRSKVAITTASAGQPRVVSITSRVEFEPGDYVELYLANEGGTGDITVSTLNATV